MYHVIESNLTNGREWLEKYIKSNAALSCWETAFGFFDQALDAFFKEKNSLPDAALPIFSKLVDSICCLNQKVLDSEEFISKFGNYKNSVDKNIIYQHLVEKYLSACDSIISNKKVIKIQSENYLQLLEFSSKGLQIINKLPLNFNEKYRLLLLKGEAEIGLTQFAAASSTFNCLSGIKVSDQEVQYWLSLVKFHNSTESGSLAEKSLELIKEIDERVIVNSVLQLGMNVRSFMAASVEALFDIKVERVTIAIEVGITLKIMAYILQAKIYLACDNFELAMKKVNEANGEIIIQKTKYLLDDSLTSSLFKKPFPYKNEQSEVLWLHGGILLASAVKKKQFAGALDKFMEARSLSDGKNMRRLSLTKQQIEKIHDSYLKGLLEKNESNKEPVGVCLQTRDEIAKIDSAKIISSSFFGAKELDLLKKEMSVSTDNIQATKFFLEINYYYDMARYKYLCGEILEAVKFVDKLIDVIDSDGYAKVEEIIKSKYKDRFEKYTNIDGLPQEIVPEEEGEEESEKKQASGVRQ